MKSCSRSLSVTHGGSVAGGGSQRREVGRETFHEQACPDRLAYSSNLNRKSNNNERISRAPFHVKHAQLR